MGAKRRKKRGIKRKAVLSKIMERTAQNRVIFGAGTKKKKSRNPHGYWIFRWRRRWDSNPRALSDNSISSRARYDRFDTSPFREYSVFGTDNMISSQARYDHFDTAPYMLNRCFSSLFFGEKGLWKELTERTANLFNFRTG